MPLDVGAAFLEEEVVLIAKSRRRGQSRRPIYKAFGIQEQARPGRWSLWLSFFLDWRAALAPTLKSDAAVHLAHDPVLLPPPAFARRHCPLVS